jgi:hypothetical protein
LVAPQILGLTLRHDDSHQPCQPIGSPKRVPGWDGSPRLGPSLIECSSLPIMSDSSPSISSPRPPHNMATPAGVLSRRSDQCRFCRQSSLERRALRPRRAESRTFLTHQPSHKPLSPTDRSFGTFGIEPPVVLEYPLTNEAEVNRLACRDGNQIAHPALSGTTFRPLSAATFSQIRMETGVPAHAHAGEVPVWYGARKRN